VWTADRALDGFESTTLPLTAHDDGELCATLVRRVPDANESGVSARRAVLYVHGFVDYFFQTHVADAFAAAGWDFYALDLRRYGRSLRGRNRPNFCTDLAQYDEEIGAAIAIVREEDGHDTLALMGHSTGGLTTSWYAHRGARRREVNALVLNSPFFEFSVPSSARLQLAIASALGALWPSGADTKGLPRWYGESLLAEYHGEWTYDLRWKPLLGFPIYFGWVRAVRQVQARLADGLSIACPVLLLHAGSSTHAKGAWSDAYQANDIVLNVAHMKERGPRLGQDVTMHEFPNGIHDLTLSRAAVRNEVLRTTLQWLDDKVGAPTRGSARV
jgi:alpha-beta hydrolase superfamily lysophospholipase